MSNDAFVKPSAWHINRGETAPDCIESGRYDTVRKPADDAEGADVWVILEYVQAGDYSGGSVGRSNLRVFEEEHAALFTTEPPVAVIVRGSHGYRAVAVTYAAWSHEERRHYQIEADEEGLTAEENARLTELDSLARTLAGLADYPLISEDDHSQLESEEESEAWEGWGRSDFRRELQKAFPSLEDAIESADDGKLDSLYYDTTANVGRYAEHDVEGVSFPFREVLRELSELNVAAALQ